MVKFDCCLIHHLMFSGGSFAYFFKPLFHFQSKFWLISYWCCVVKTPVWKMLSWKIAPELFPTKNFTVMFTRVWATVCWTIKLKMLFLLWFILSDQNHFRSYEANLYHLDMFEEILHFKFYGNLRRLVVINTIDILQTVAERYCYP